jgi:hypothetical protein
VSVGLRNDRQLLRGLLDLGVVLLAVGVIDLSVEEEQFLLEFLTLSDQKGKFPFIVLALITKEHIGLDEFMAFLLQLLLPVDHFILNLLLVGIGLQFIEFLLRSDQLLLVLLNQLRLFLVEMRMQLHVQLFNQGIEVGFCLLDGLDVGPIGRG